MANQGNERGGSNRWDRPAAPGGATRRRAQESL